MTVDALMKNGTATLSLDRPATYEIRVPGQIDERWLPLNQGMAFRFECEANQSVTVLIGDLDQAALQGILRQLYSMGLPLISVNVVQQGVELT